MEAIHETSRAERGRRLISAVPAGTRFFPIAYPAVPAGLFSFAPIGAFLADGTTEVTPDTPRVEREHGRASLYFERPQNPLRHVSSLTSFFNHEVVI